MRVYALLLLLALAAPRMHADGGRLQFRQQAGGFVITLFTTPDPLTVGRVDFSVAVERPATPGIIQDADVTLILTPAGGKGDDLVLHASHEAATSRFLQAANFTLPRSGIWQVKVIVQQGTQMGRCAGQIEVLPSRIATNETAWEIAVVPILVLLFALHQWRKRAFRHGTQTQLPDGPAHVESERG